MLVPYFKNSVLEVETVTLFVPFLLKGTTKRQTIDNAVADDAALKTLPDDAYVCRGGTCTATRFAKGSGVQLDSQGKLSGVSVNSALGQSVKELTKSIPNKQVGVTTVGEVRKTGGDILPSGTLNNPYHCTLCGITPLQAEKLFTPTIINPNLK